MEELLKGRINVLIDGQFGSTGKGLMAGYLAEKHNIDWAVTNASANAGHTCVDRLGKRTVCYHLPTAAVINHETMAYLDAGAIIDPTVLDAEIRETGFDPGRLIIHPRAAVIEEQDRMLELSIKSSAERIASTQHGVGAALARKIGRSATLAGTHPKLKHFCNVVDLGQVCRNGGTVLLEVPQGFSLGINSGLAYPYCTSRDVTVSQALADAGVHPHFLGHTIMTVRTFPIRVGNIGGPDRDVLGWSGPWYEDQEEMTWKQIGVAPEITTVTKRERRVATFSHVQYALACRALRPDFVFLNFVNYIREREQLSDLLSRMERIGPVTHFGLGPSTLDVYDNIGDVVKRMGWR